MEITFKYKDKVITTPNLEKKLKRMKIQLSDIEIIETPIKKEENSGIEDYIKDKKQVIIKSTLDDIQRVCYVKKGTKPPIKDILGKQGIYSKEQLESMYYVEGNIAQKNE